MIAAILLSAAFAHAAPCPKGVVDCPAAHVARYLFVGTYRSGSVGADIELGCGGSIRGPFRFVGHDGKVVVDVPAGKSLTGDVYPDAGKVCAGKP